MEEQTEFNVDTLVKSGHNRLPFVRVKAPLAEEGKKVKYFGYRFKALTDPREVEITVKRKKQKRTMLNVEVLETNDKDATVNSFYCLSIGHKVARERLATVSSGDIFDLANIGKPQGATWYNYAFKKLPRLQQKESGVFV